MACFKQFAKLNFCFNSTVVPRARLYLEPWEQELLREGIIKPLTQFFKHGLYHAVISCLACSKTSEAKQARDRKRHHFYSRVLIRHAIRANAMWTCELFMLSRKAQRAICHKCIDFNFQSVRTCPCSRATAFPQIFEYVWISGVLGVRSSCVKRNTSKTFLS